MARGLLPLGIDRCLIHHRRKCIKRTLSEEKINIRFDNRFADTHTHTHTHTHREREREKKREKEQIISSISSVPFE